MKHIQVHITDGRQINLHINIHKNDDTGKLTINIYITYNSRVNLSRRYQRVN